MSDGMILLDGATEPDQRSAATGGGQFVAYTCRSPDKSTENEDTVAVIPYGPGAAVMLVADGAGGLPAGKRASLTAASSLAESLQQRVFDELSLPLQVGIASAKFLARLAASGRLVESQLQLEAWLRRIGAATEVKHPAELLRPPRDR